MLEDQKSGSGGRLQLADANPILTNLAGLGSIAAQSSLETEVIILESPSVLKPVFDFVKTRKAATGKHVSNWTYSAWVNNLSIELAKGTSILSVSYKDTDQSLVLPVLTRITKTYQGIQIEIAQIQLTMA